MRHDCAVRVFDLTRGLCVLELPTDQGPIWTMDWHPSMHRVAAGCSDEAVDYWDADPRDSLAGSRVLLKVGMFESQCKFAHVLPMHGKHVVVSANLVHPASCTAAC